MLHPSAILLRVCCIPVDSFLLAGNPKLFALCEHLDEVTKLLDQDSRTLVDDILASINANRLPRLQSKCVGAVVRRLGRLAQLRKQDLEAVEGGVLDQDLVMRLHAFQRAQRDAQDLKRNAMGLLVEEPARAASALIDGVLSRPDGVELLRHRNPQFFDQRRIGSRDAIHWSSKQGYRNAAYLYSIITRATLRTVPRDWHTQVAFVPVGEAGEPPSRTGRIACLWTENVHALRSRLAVDMAAVDGLDVRLSLAPIRWNTAERIVFCVTDFDKPAEVREVDLKRSAFLDTIIGCIGEVGASAGKVIDHVAGADRQQREVTRGFLGHLANLGVIVCSRSPTTRMVSWTQPAAAASELPVSLRADGYLDVYSDWTGCISCEIARTIQSGFAVIAQLSNFVDATARAATTSPSGPQGVERSLIDLVREYLLNPVSEPAIKSVAPVGEWPAQTHLQTNYANFTKRLRDQFNTERIVITSCDLDEACAPQWHLRWPVDVMVRLSRPETGFIGVFDEAFAAGSMDARFIWGARKLELAVPHCDFYRKFLVALEQLGKEDFRFVELLVPPLAFGAANAVRRPALVRSWTGDPDWQFYFTEEAGPPHFIPLGKLRIRDTKRGRRVFAGEQMLLPMYHATRLPIPPWNVLTDLLLNAVPSQIRWAPRRLHRLLDAFPDAAHAPRLEVESGLVVSAEQWRLPPEIPWRVEDDVLAKVIALRRMQRRLGLPRLLFISPGPFKRPVACDLESIEVLPVLEAALKGATDPLAIRMTPGLNETLLTDAGDFSSTAMLRLPLDETPEALAQALLPNLT